MPRSLLLQSAQSEIVRKTAVGVHEGQILVKMHYFEPIDLETEKEIWKADGKAIENVKEDVEALKNWLNSQPHLPHTLTNGQVRAFLLMNRGSVEKTKPKIDMYFSIRTIFPNVFQNSNPFSERVLQALKYMYYIPLPKLCADLSRILVVKIKDVDATDMDAFACLAHYMNVIELRLLEDMCHGHSAIIDMQHCKVSYMVKLTPMFFKSLYTVGAKALTTRVTAIHIINAPSFIDQTLLVVKSIIKPKLANRIIIHKDAASMLNSVDKNILPKDYGGNEKSLVELEELLYKRLAVHREFFDQRDQLRVNEDLRPAENRNDELLGYYGNFRQLDVD